MKINKYAPVIIPTLCRYGHFKRCVDSLSRCTGADKTKLIIGLDYPAKKEHEEGYHKISEYIPTISGFEEIIVQKRDRNYGAVNNVRALYDYVYGFSDRCIYTEDDNEFSPNFLEYINKGLDLYKDNPQVIGICGYMYPFKLQQCVEYFAGCGFSAWGCGRWREKNFNSTNVKTWMENILLSWKKSWKLYKKRPTTLNSFITMFLNNVCWGDSLLCGRCVLEGKFSIFPMISKVRNIGNDGSGLHCKCNESLNFQKIDTELTFEFGSDVEITGVVNFTPYMRVGILKRIAILFRYFYFRMTHKDLLSFYFRRKIV